ncbi:MAG: type II toxin-antitoxin system HigB family toxin [Flavobacteriales bacterium]|nr:type II toxin-antitoxin system HigB family toxin [Flavobacteriales bacterium]
MPKLSVRTKYQVRVVFNIKGNNYRLVLRVNYDYSVVWIRFIATYGECDKINASKI